MYPDTRIKHSSDYGELLPPGRVQLVRLPPPGDTRYGGLTDSWIVWFHPDWVVDQRKVDPGAQAVCRCRLPPLEPSCACTLVPSAQCPVPNAPAPASAYPPGDRRIGNRSDRQCLGRQSALLGGRLHTPEDEVCTAYRRGGNWIWRHRMHAWNAFGSKSPSDGAARQGLRHGGWV